MDDKQRILVDAFAWQNADFWPQRDVNQKLRAVTYERQLAFHRAGIALHAGDSSEAGRKQFGRLVSDLCRERLLERFRSQAARTLSVRLTLAGELVAAAITGHDGSYENVKDFCRDTLAYEDHDEAGAEPFHGWVPEFLLAGVRWGEPDYSREIHITDIEALPALRHRFVEFQATVHGHGWYKLTPGGRRIADGSEVWELPAVERPPADTEALEHYKHTWEAAMHTIRAARPIDSGELGSLPHPAGVPTNKSVREWAEREAAAAGGAK